MKRTVLSIAALLLFAGSVCAQNDKVEKIRERYKEISRYIEEESVALYNLTLQANVPAIGPQLTDIVFYHPFAEYSQDQEALFHHPYKIVVEYNVAASLNIIQEFLFDENGVLLFFFEKALGVECYEKRLYFDMVKLVKFSYKPVSENCDGEPSGSTVEKTGDFSEDMVTDAETALSQAAGYSLGFKALFDLNQLK